MIVARGMAGFVLGRFPESNLQADGEVSPDVGTKMSGCHVGGGLWCDALRARCGNLKGKLLPFVGSSIRCEAGICPPKRGIGLVSTSKPHRKSHRMISIFILNGPANQDCSKVSSSFGLLQTHPPRLDRENLQVSQQRGCRGSRQESLDPVNSLPKPWLPGLGPLGGGEPLGNLGCDPLGFPACRTSKSSPLSRAFLGLTWPWGRTYGSILAWMNIRLPPILMFNRGTGF